MLSIAPRFNQGDHCQKIAVSIPTQASQRVTWSKRGAIDNYGRQWEKQKQKKFTKMRTKVHNKINTQIKKPNLKMYSL